jgi:hypothetical protein
VVHDERVVAAIRLHLLEVKSNVVATITLLTLSPRSTWTRRGPDQRSRTTRGAPPRPPRLSPRHVSSWRQTAASPVRPIG